MVKIVFASHGSLAEGMLSAVRMIMGEEIGTISAYGLDTYETPKKMADLIQQEIDSSPNDSFVLLCDIKGGSVYNQLIPLCDDTRVSVFTGMNLNLALELAGADTGTSWDEIRQEAIDLAKDGIAYFDKKTIYQQVMEDDALW